MFLTGVVFPIMCFVSLALGMQASVGPHWQSGEAITYCAMILTWQATSCFIPLILFSMVCMAVWTVNPQTMRSPVIQLGILGGALQSAIFLVLIFATSGPLTLFAAPVVGAALAAITWGFSVLLRRSRTFSIKEILIATTVVAVPAAVISRFGLVVTVFEFLFTSYITILVAAPTLNALTYGRASLMVSVSTDQTWAWPSGTFAWARLVVLWPAWIVAFVITWRFAVVKAMAEYAKLPPTSPDCYVSAAAAAGHRSLVGSRPIASGEAVHLVNMQMRRLKLLEFALRAICPRLHLWIRLAYNRCGPRLASRCRSNRIFADATFLCLLPLEALAELVRHALAIDVDWLNKIYGS